MYTSLLTAQSPLQEHAVQLILPSMNIEQGSQFVRVVVEIAANMLYDVYNTVQGQLKLPSRDFISIVVQQVRTVEFDHNYARTVNK